MDYEGVKAGLEDNSIVLIDVRTTEERTEEHGAIPGSKHIWIDELSDAFKLDGDDFEAKCGFPKPSADTVLVTHCMMGGRAGKGAAALKEMGFSKVYNYKGSFKDWVAKGGAVEK